MQRAETGWALNSIRARGLSRAMRSTARLGRQKPARADLCFTALILRWPLSAKEIYKSKHYLKYKTLFKI